MKADAQAIMLHIRPMNCAALSGERLQFRLRSRHNSWINQMNLKASLVSGLVATIMLIGGIATTGSAFAQSSGPQLYSSCISRAPISRVQRQLTHAKSANLMDTCGQDVASAPTVYPHSLASSGTSHSTNNPNNVR
jgi:hypothetical protein